MSSHALYRKLIVIRSKVAWNDAAHVCHCVLCLFVCEGGRGFHVCACFV